MALTDFANAARSLARNPLGIIALFLVLVYAMAVLLFGLSGASMSENERLVILIFVVLFPVLVLVAFYRLVTKHHNKLYAPSDWRDESHFLKAMNVELPADGDLPAEAQGELELIKGKRFGDETVTIDGKRFEDCIFNDTRLKFRGTRAVQFVSSTFVGVKWIFGGNAALTFAFVSMLYRAMGDDVGRPLLDYVIKSVKGGKD
ncbi:MAG: hypothetical protein A3F74_22040 [Betaproteobacteria bacterium RIFCSPLOWO2_12_FULL_62_58]|nr:MAG: hypothetical protein A3F74_22040 [Betaproteobacteria bacterium RIFCSPLOWO2_12_FULL_62_58]